ncbi:MAG TPA: hypothetical protein DCR97_03390 [Deltaproteobacteria bacterium]|nr:hypothetical protein [Deltaproteobacteria bacterium]
MNKFLVLVLFVLVLVGSSWQPFCAVDSDQLVYAAPGDPRGGHGGGVGNGVGKGGGKGGGYGGGHGGGRGHGVPDLGTSLSLLGLGVAAAGAYSIYRKRKAK